MALTHQTTALIPSLISRIDNKTLRYATIFASVVLGSLLFAVSAKTHVPFYPVPMTMQVFAAFVLASAYGWRLGVATYVLYMLEGAFGLPVFSGTPERGIGLAYLAGPTLGYLIGFGCAIAAFGLYLEKFKSSPLWLSTLAALGCLGGIYLLGCAWLVQFVGFSQLLAVGVLPFVLGDIVKVVLAVLVAFGLQKSKKAAK